MNQGRRKTKTTKMEQTAAFLFLTIMGGSIIGLLLMIALSPVVAAIIGMIAGAGLAACSVAQTRALDDCAPHPARELLSRCPRCGGEIRAIQERHYSLCGGTWVETGSGEELYCENDCDLAEYSGRIPEVPEES